MGIIDLSRFTLYVAMAADACGLTVGSSVARGVIT
jgi:hypothetical protein